MGWISATDEFQSSGHLLWVTRLAGQGVLHGDSLKMHGMTVMCHSTYHVTHSLGE